MSQAREKLMINLKKEKPRVFRPLPGSWNKCCNRTGELINQPCNSVFIEFNSGKKKIKSIGGNGKCIQTINYNLHIWAFDIDWNWMERTEKSGKGGRKKLWTLSSAEGALSSVCYYECIHPYSMWGHRKLTVGSVFRENNACVACMQTFYWKTWTLRDRSTFFFNISHFHISKM